MSAQLTPPWNFLPGGSRSKGLQAKHVPYFPALLTLAGRTEWSRWEDVAPLYPGVPFAVLTAAFRRMHHQYLLNGCIHSGRDQCRGDLELGSLGHTWVAAAHSLIAAHPGQADAVVVAFDRAYRRSVATMPADRAVDHAAVVAAAAVPTLIVVSNQLWVPGA